MAGARAKRARRPRCLLIAGPNGAGKTTFAHEYLPHDARILRFVNADLIAAGLSPLAPQRAALAAARLERLKASGYHIEIIFLRVASPHLALQRIAARVKQGGHPVPKADVLRRFVRGWKNFETLYRPLADTWSVYDNSGVKPVLLEQGP